MLLKGLVSDQELKAQLGALISDRGSSRDVYAYAGESGWVIKVYKLLDRPPMSNFTEWMIWRACAEPPDHDPQQVHLKTLLAECIAISVSGKYLVMEYLENLTSSDIANPPLMPSFLDDKKSSAFGRAADGSIKARDYGLVNIGRHLAKGGPLVAPVWR